MSDKSAAQKAIPLLETLLANRTKYGLGGGFAPPNYHPEAIADHRKIVDRDLCEARECQRKLDGLADEIIKSAIELGLDADPKLADGIRAFMIPDRQGPTEADFTLIPALKNQLQLVKWIVVKQPSGRARAGSNGGVNPGSLASVHAGAGVNLVGGSACRMALDKQDLWILEIYSSVSTPMGQMEVVDALVRSDNRRLSARTMNDRLKKLRNHKLISRPRGKKQKDQITQIGRKILADYLNSPPA